MSTGQPGRRLIGMRARIVSIAVSSDGTVLATGADDCRSLSAPLTHSLSHLPTDCRTYPLSAGLCLPHLPIVCRTYPLTACLSVLFSFALLHTKVRMLACKACVQKRAYSLVRSLSCILSRAYSFVHTKACIQKRAYSLVHTKACILVPMKAGILSLAYKSALVPLSIFATARMLFARPQWERSRARMLSPWERAQVEHAPQHASSSPACSLNGRDQAPG